MQETNLMKMGAAIFTFFGIVASCLFSSFWNTFVTMHLWNWFVVPVFHLSVITFWSMFGILLSILAITGISKYNKTDEDDKSTMEKYLKVFLISFFGYGFMGFIGYIIHHFFLT